MTSSQDTALGTARARFVDALPRKGRELKAAVALLAGAPEARRPREELRRRLHALYASAQVFRIGSLADALKDAIKRLDRARDEERSLTQEDLDALSHLAATLPALTSSVGGEASVQDQQTTVPGSHAAVEPLDPNEPPPPPRVPSRSPPSSPRDRQKTLTGIIAQRRTKSEERLGAAKERLARLVETLAEEKDTVEVTPFRSQLQAATPPEVRARVEDGGSGSAVKPMDAAEREARNERAEALTPVARLETPEMLDDGMAQAKETLPVGEALWMGEAEESEPAGRSEGPSIREAVPTISGASVGEGPAGEGASGLGTAGQDVADDAGDDAGDDAVPSGGAATGVDSLEEAIAENASTREAAAREAPTHEAAIGDSPRSEAQLPESDGPKADAARRPPHAPGTFSGGGAPRRIAALDTVLSVLVVDSVEWQARMVGALPSEHFEVAAASDPEAALRLARTTAPDVVVGDRSLLVEADIDFVGRLRSDPLTDFVPVIALVDSAAMSDLVAVREDGIDEILEKPFDASTLIRAIRKVTGTLPEEQLFDEFGELTLSELADRLATEIKRGIADSAERGRDTKIAMGDGVELLAAAWSTIARVRAHVAQRSGGKVRYRDQPRRGGPAVMALVDDDAAATDVEVDLTGRRIVVADDDPAVVWFFAGVLREAGATVIEAENGREAFEAARRRAPDAIISDILMPELDGFGLCRALRRDPALSHVPVILISWKEDFLQRMRELSAGASGYLRKEAGSGQILEKVREVLRPRAQLEARLKAGGDVRGRIERTGILTLLRSVAACRPNARVTARDAWNLFEVDLREGNLVDLTRTATDGSFARGPRALPQLLGAQAGRFTVSDAEGPLRATFEQPLESELGRSADQLGAVLDAVSGTNLPLASNIDFRPDVLHALEHTSPEPVRALVERLAQGEAPREILADGSTSASALESALGDLARHGAILGVQGPAGEDRIAIALEDRRAGRDIPSVAPPPRDSGTADDVRPSVLAAMKAIAPPLDPAAAEEAEDERPPRERKTSEEVAALDDPFTAPEAGSTPPGAELEQLVRASVAPEEPATPGKEAERQASEEPGNTASETPAKAASDAPLNQELAAGSSSAPKSLDSEPESTEPTGEADLGAKRDALQDEAERTETADAKPAAEADADLGAADATAEEAQAGEAKESVEAKSVEVRDGEGSDSEEPAEPDEKPRPVLELVPSEPPEALEGSEATMESLLGPLIAGDAARKADTGDGDASAESSIDTASRASVGPEPASAAGDAPAPKDPSLPATELSLSDVLEEIRAESLSEPDAHKRFGSEQEGTDPTVRIKKDGDSDAPPPKESGTLSHREEPPATPTLAPQESESSGPGVLGLIFSITVLFVVGFVGMGIVTGLWADPPAPTPPPGVVPAPPVEDVVDDPTPTPVVPEEPPGAGETFQQVVPYEDSCGEGDDCPRLPDDHGLLVVEPPPDGAEVELRLGDTSYSDFPVRVAVPEGRTELEFRRGEELFFRFYVIRAGQTHFLTAP